MNSTVERPEPKADPPAAALIIRDVAVRFGTGESSVVAIEGVNCDVALGGFTTIIGPSGCGKSTLLRAISDLIPVSAGTIEVLGGSPHDAREQRKIGFVFQDAALLPWRTALENVRLPLEIGPSGKVKSSPAGAPSPREMLALVGLAGREDALPHQLSGGMRQRVSIARALLTRPDVLLMDEPFGALDEITRDKLNLELLRVWEETGTTIVFVTHSIPEAVFLSGQVIVLSANPGRVREVVQIDLPTPRDRAVRGTREFVELTEHLRDLLES